MILWLSLKSFFTSNKLLSIAFTALMIVCLTGSLFGVNCVLSEVDTYNEYSFELKEYKISRLGTDTRENILTLLERYPDFFCVVLGVLKDETSAQEKSEIMAIAEFDDAYGDILKPSYGRAISAEEYRSGAHKIILGNDSVTEEYKIGATVTLFGGDYEVVGVFGNTILSFFSLQDDLQLTRVELHLKEAFSTKEESDEFCKTLSEIFLGSTVVGPQAEFQTIFEHAPSLFSTLILVLLGFVNLSFLYLYFIRIRKSQYAVYRIGGASVAKIFGLFLAEIAALFTMAFLVSVAVFEAMMALYYAPTGSLILILARGTEIVNSFSFVRLLTFYVVAMAALIVAFLPSLIKSARTDLANLGGK